MDIRRFLTSVVIYAGTSAVATAVPVLLLPLLTRVLSPADYGLVGLFLIYVNIATPLVGLGLNGALSVRYFQDDWDFNSYVNACVRITALLWLILNLAYPLLSPLLHSVAKMPTPWVLAAICAAAANSVILLRLAIWQAERRAAAFGTTRILQAFTDVGFSILFVLAIWQSWQGRAFAMTLAFILVGLLCLRSLYRGGYILRGLDGEAARDALRFGVPLLPHLLGSLTLSFADRLLVSNLLGLDALGTYMVAAQIGLVLNLVIVSVNRAFAPVLMRLLSKEDDAMNARVVRLSYIYMIGIAMIAAPAAVVSPALVTWVAPPEFEPAAAVLPWIIAGTVFTAWYYTVTNYLFYAGRTGWLSLATLVSAGVAVPSSILLIKAHGLVGAGQAYALGQLVSFLVTFGFAIRAHPMPWIRAVAFARS